MEGLEIPASDKVGVLTPEVEGQDGVELRVRGLLGVHCGGWCSRRDTRRAEGLGKECGWGWEPAGERGRGSKSVKFSYRFPRGARVAELQPIGVPAFPRRHVIGADKGGMQASGRNNLIVR